MAVDDGSSTSLNAVHGLLHDAVLKAIRRVEPDPGLHSRPPAQDVPGAWEVAGEPRWRPSGADRPLHLLRGIGA